jgi:glyoxylate reductase
MAKPKVFVTRVIPDEGLAMVRQATDAEIWPGELPPPYEVLFDKVRGMDAVLTLLTDKMDAGLMDEAGPSLKVISQMAVGYDNIDVAAATARRLPVGHTPGVLTETTADFAWTLMMAAARRVVEGDAFTRRGLWKTWGPTLLMGPDVNGATLGIVGLGRIGTAMARRARGFDMQVLYYDPERHPAQEQALCLEYADFETLLSKSDFVTLHTPLSEQTRHLIGEAQLRQMKRSAILINTARGPLVDPEALYQALKDGLIAYAALDVTEPEPIEMTSPLLTLENVIIAPHIASASLQTRNKMATMAVANLLAGLQGQRLPFCVNPEVYG